jgi:hypothetical protein
MEYVRSSPHPHHFGFALAAWTCGQYIMIASQPTKLIDRSHQDDVGSTHWNILNTRTVGDEPDHAVCRFYLMKPPDGLPRGRIDMRYAQELLDMAKPPLIPNYKRTAEEEEGEGEEEEDQTDLWPADNIEARTVGYMYPHAVPPKYMAPDVVSAMPDTDEDWSFSLDVYMLEHKTRVVARVMELPLDKVASNEPQIEPLKDWGALWERRYGSVMPELKGSCPGEWDQMIWKPLNIMSRLLKTDGNEHMFSGARARTKAGGHHRKNNQSIAIERHAHIEQLYKHLPDGRITIDASLWKSMNSKERSRVIRANKVANKQHKRVSDTQAAELVSVGPKSL